MHCAIGRIAGDRPVRLGQARCGWVTQRERMPAFRLSALLAMDSDFANGALDLRGGNEQRLRGLVEGVASRLVLCGIAPAGEIVRRVGIGSWEAKALDCLGDDQGDRRRIGAGGIRPETFKALPSLRGGAGE